MKPQNISVVRNDRRFSGQNSEVSVIALGIAPPRPMPVRKRRMVSSVIEVDQADARLAPPKKITVRTSAYLRPILSASGPKMKAPDHQAEQAGAEQRRQLGRRDTPLGSAAPGR